ncbi:MAG: FmdB family zinc ribbon protein [Candidatus Methylomirabilales bacterium]
MPIYDFRCTRCSKKFTLTMTIKQRETGRIKCPKCRANKPEPIFGTFYARTSRKS